MQYTIYKKITKPNDYRIIILQLFLLFYDKKQSYYKGRKFLLLQQPSIRIYARTSLIPCTINFLASTAFSFGSASIPSNGYSIPSSLYLLTPIV